jgi:hypothetical protein
MVDAIALAEYESLRTTASASSTKERETAGERNKIFLLFEKPGGNVFTPTALREICTAEALFVENRQFAGGGANYPGTCNVSVSRCVFLFVFLDAQGSLTDVGLCGHARCTRAPTTRRRSPGSSRATAGLLCRSSRTGFSTSARLAATPPTSSAPTATTPAR